MDYDEMRAFQYAEENPGYQREIPPIVPTVEDTLDPDWHESWLAAQEHTDGENRLIRASNERTEAGHLRDQVGRLKALLVEHGIDHNEPEEY